MTKEKFFIEKVSNMIMISSEQGTIWECWDETELTERKLKNGMNRIQKMFNYPITFIKKEG